MILEGVNQAKDLILDRDGCYNVELSRIALPHLPVSRSVIGSMKLGKQDLLGHFITERLVKYPAFKVVAVTAMYRDGVQVIRGKIRSNGVGMNLSNFIKEHRPAEVRFMLRGKIGSSDNYPDAFEIKNIDGWTLPHPG
jgi:hypothetical protein